MAAGSAGDRMATAISSVCVDDLKYPTSPRYAESGPGAAKARMTERLSS